MAIGNDEFGIVGRTTDGKKAILELDGVTASGQYALPFRTTDGKRALMRVVPVDADAQFGFPGRLTDGGIGLFAPYTAPPIACNSCSPPLLNEYTVTYAGLAGDFAAYNGAHTVTWVSGCTWASADGKITLVYTGGRVQWMVSLTLSGTCFIKFGHVVGTGGPCDPGIVEPLSLNSGSSTGCADTSSYANSAGATCVVS